MNLLPTGTTALGEIDDAWRIPGQGARLRAVRAAAEELRARLAGGPRVLSVRALPRMTFLYPTRYAFHGTLLFTAPFVVLTHRTWLVQFLQRGVLKNLLFDPTDVERAADTPFFARLRDATPRRLWGRLFTPLEPLEAQLRGLGLSPEDVDYLAFDHLHMQDLRGLLGTDEGPARFPNAVLLTPAPEWDEWDDPHPLQRAWLVRDGKRGVPEERVVLTTRDLLLGDGVMLVRTPGKTAGHQTLFLNTSTGVWGVSACGSAADGWSPRASRIPGFARACRLLDVDVVMNTNAPGLGAEQYTSMILERTLVDRAKRDFVQMLASSEVTPGRFSLGLFPPMVHGGFSTGDLVEPVRAAAVKKVVAPATARV